MRESAHHYWSSFSAGKFSNFPKLTPLVSEVNETLGFSSSSVSLAPLTSTRVRCQRQDLKKLSASMEKAGGDREGIDFLLVTDPSHRGDSMLTGEREFSCQIKSEKTVGPDLPSSDPSPQCQHL